METLKAIESRRSIRCYTDQPVTQKQLDQVLAAGNSAPVAGTFQMTVVTNKGVLKQINDSTLESMKNSGNDFLMGRAALEGYQPLYGSPAMIVLSAHPSGYSQINTACAATNMVLAAVDLGLGSCFIVSPTLVLNGEDELSRKIGINSGYKPICCVLLGYSGGDQFQSRRAPADNINYVR